jgi:hypothetical protein
MGRVVRVMLGLVIGGCVMLAVLTGLFAQFFTGGALRPSVAKGHEYAAEASGPADSMDAMVEAMHARNRLERGRIVAQISEEFGIDVDPDRFSSHHTARDYLERLRLAREASELGIEADAEAFGDDEFMRRHLEAARPGGALARGAAAPTAADLVRLSSDTYHAMPLHRGNYIFIHGRRYYPDGHGAYVSADGSVLGLSTAKQARHDPDAAGVADAGGDAPAWDSGLLGDLDKVLDLLGVGAGDDN